MCAYLMFVLWLFSFSLFCACPVFVLFLFLDVCLFSKERQKNVSLRGGKVGEISEELGEGKLIRIYHVKIIYFQ